ncbi:RNA polymerase sigma factor [Cryobacterium sp. TMT4-31]|uniref:RNA polymerase sigma factor n=1 Tax=Cryobacterium sp. TMT4-31 TaxID=1259259 RepID=UPI00106D1AB1|nr:RNA polymerase sigma factor [Cryobacterium sp. TMT4-31]TFC87414.1 RNA polymerase sigma factor [Cryobacterium sp. TMT4-31]
MTAARGTNEYELWARAVEGDAGAFGELFDEHRDRVFGHALRSLASRHDAEDATAIVFLELWRHRRRVRVVNGSIIGWLLVTTNNVCRNQSRSARRYRLSLAKLSPEQTHPDPSDELAVEIDRARNAPGVREVFSQLSARDQDVLTLCVLEELTNAEAALALRIPIGTVKSRLFRAKKRMAELMVQSAPDTRDQWSLS